jgi:hypothetical protein
MNAHLWALTAACLLFTPGLAQDRKKDAPGPGPDARPGPLVVLGTVLGEITQVDDGGSKIEVKYKELVESTARRSVTGLRAGRVRLPNTTVKERNRELELRVYPATTIRLVNAGPDGKGEAAAKEAAAEGEESDSRSTNDKKANKSGKERPLPGKAGERKDLAKGQVIIVTVAQERAAGFTRYVATSIYVLGEK